jgi:hypothetical protein
MLARILHIHEPASKTSLTLIDRLRAYFDRAGISSSSEYAALVGALGFDGAMEEELRPGENFHPAVHAVVRRNHFDQGPRFA